MSVAAFEAHIKQRKMFSRKKVFDVRLGIAQHLMRQGTHILQIYWIDKDAIDLELLDGRSVSDELFFQKEV